MRAKTCIGVYIALILLLLASWFSHSLHLGIGNVVLNLGVAATKAALIALFFMHLLKETNTVRIFSLIGVAWLAILFSLSLSDYLTRDKPDVFYAPAASQPSVMTNIR